MKNLIILFILIASITTGCKKNEENNAPSDNNSKNLTPVTPIPENPTPNFEEEKINAEIKYENNTHTFEIGKKINPIIPNTLKGSKISISISFGKLPQGLTISSDGVISGTPVELTHASNVANCCSAWGIGVEAKNDFSQSRFTLNIRVIPSAAPEIKVTTNTLNYIELQSLSFPIDFGAHYIDKLIINNKTIDLKSNQLQKLYSDQYDVFYGLYFNPLTKKIEGSARDFSHLSPHKRRVQGLLIHVENMHGRRSLKLHYSVQPQKKVLDPNLNLCLNIDSIIKNKIKNQPHNKLITNIIDISGTQQQLSSPIRARYLDAFAFNDAKYVEEKFVTNATLQMNSLNENSILKYSFRQNDCNKVYIRSNVYSALAEVEYDILRYTKDTLFLQKSTSSLSYMPNTIVFAFNDEIKGTLNYFPGYLYWQESVSRPLYETIECEGRQFNEYHQSIDIHRRVVFSSQSSINDQQHFVTNTFKNEIDFISGRVTKWSDYYRSQACIGLMRKSSELYSLF